MAKKTLADDVHDVLIGRTPGEVKCIRREKSEGRSKHPRVKALHVEKGRVRFRITEPGEAHDIHVHSTDAAGTVEAVYQVAQERGVKFESVGSP